MAKSRVRILAIVLAGLVVGAGYIVYDLNRPVRSSLKSFDPDEVAHLETEMWRSYYDRQQAKLFFQLAELLRTEYNLPFVRSHVVAWDAAKAAFVFKRGRERRDYERAIPPLIEYYREIRDVAVEPFEVSRVAELELEWWIVHRERKDAAPGALDRALADLQAAVFGLPAEVFEEHARLRAEAMTIRDDRAETGGVSETDWLRIDELLRISWRSLHDAVNASP